MLYQGLLQLMKESWFRILQKVKALREQIREHIRKIMDANHFQRPYILFLNQFVSNLCMNRLQDILPHTFLISQVDQNKIEP